jgi:hypothetical protein
MKGFIANKHVLLLPDWVHYLSMNEDDEWFGYESEPTAHEDCGEWLHSAGRYIAIPGTENFAPKGIPTKWDESIVVLAE